MHKKTLRDNGIKLVSAMENIPDTPEGIILESLLEGMAEYYSVECFYGHNFTDVLSNIRFVYLELPLERYLAIRFYAKLLSKNNQFKKGATGKDFMSIIRFFNLFLVLFSLRQSIINFV